MAAPDACTEVRRFFDSLNAANRYAVLYRVNQAKGPERRTVKIAEIIRMIAPGRAFHFPRKPRRVSA